MHHSLRLYGRFREMALRYYIFQAKWTRIPVIGGLVRRLANGYGQGVHGAYLLTLEEAHRVIEASPNLWVGPCRCRKVFRNCTRPVEVELMVGVGGSVLTEGKPGEYRRVSRQEAGEILDQCHRHGMIHTLLRCRGSFYALCNCCPCCCVPWRLKRDYGIGHALVHLPSGELASAWNGGLEQALR